MKLGHYDCIVWSSDDMICIDEGTQFASRSRARSGALVKILLLESCHLRLGGFLY